jgi:hypothetical protein
VRSDLSVFHRIDDPEQLSSARFFLLAERLPAYSGACRAALMEEFGPAPEQAPAVAVAAPAGERPVEVGSSPEELRALARMTDRPGMPGIEYAG